MTPVLEKIRPLVFWISDSLKGGKIRAHINDIEFIINNYSSDRASELINNRMEKLVKHAVETTSFYSSFKGFSSLCDFPVINKNILRDHFSDFFSDKSNIKDLTPKTTSGSTGIPFTIYQDNEKLIRHIAETIYFNKKAGFDLGMKLYFIRSWDERFRRSALKAWMQNITPVNIFDLTDETIELMIRRINNDRSRIVLMGFPSSFELICKYMERKHLQPVNSDVRSIIAVAEAIDEMTAASLKRYFKAPVYSRYATCEEGIIAQQVVDSDNEFLINSASLHVEVLDTYNDTYLNDGIPGRIIVTDFFNYAMPLIRYDTGDIGVIGNVKLNNRIYRVLDRVEGRKTDTIFDTSGNAIDPMKLVANMYKYQDIKQYQIVQLNKTRYQLVLNSVNPYPCIKEIESFYYNCFGENSVIEVKYVNEIPVLSSGKRKVVCNRYMDQDYIV